MELFYVLFQIYRNNAGTLSFDGCICLVKRESGSINNIIGQKLRSHSYQLVVGIIGCDQREHRINNIIDLADIQRLRLTYQLHDHLTLTFCTLEVVSCRVTDTAVGGGLYTIQCLKTCSGQRLRLYTGYLGGLNNIVIQMFNLCIIYIDINAAHQVNRLRQCRKIHTDIILDIQVQVRVQHTDRLCRTSCGISCITFIIFTIGQVQIGITVDTDQFYFLGVIVDACNNNGITSVTASQLSCFTGIQTEQGNRGITFHGGYGRLLQGLVDLNLILLHLRLLNLIQLADNPESYYKNENHCNLNTKNQHPFFLSGCSLPGTSSASG